MNIENKQRGCLCNPIVCNTGTLQSVLFEKKRRSSYKLNNIYYSLQDGIKNDIVFIYSQV